MASENMDKQGPTRFRAVSAELGRISHNLDDQGFSAFAATCREAVRLLRHGAILAARDAEIIAALAQDGHPGSSPADNVRRLRDELDVLRHEASDRASPKSRMKKIQKNPPDDERLVTVCTECLRASCWYWERPCDKAVGAGTTEVPVGRLREMAREHPENWSMEKIGRICGW